MRVYNKLIRDKIPEIVMQKEGKSCNTRVLDDKEYLEELDKKLLEEVKEYEESGEVLERADIMEVMLAILKTKGVTLEEFTKIREEKLNKRGGFEKKLFLISTED